MSPNSTSYFELWVRLDAFWQKGLGESSSADDLRDVMDEYWYRMSAAEIDEVEEAIAAREQEVSPIKET